MCEASFLSKKGWKLIFIDWKKTEGIKDITPETKKTKQGEKLSERNSDLLVFRICVCELDVLAAWMEVDHGAAFSHKGWDHIMFNAGVL